MAMQVINQLQRDLTATQNKIEHFIEETEYIYGNIYAKLPEIEQEIELTIKEIRILMDFFISQKTGGEKEQKAFHNLAKVLVDIKENCEETMKNLIDENKIHNIADLFFHGENRDDYGIEKLLKVINRIIHRIKDIEIVALNAIIYSAHLGEKGRGFSVVSENIDKTSQRLTNSYTQMKLAATQLSQWNQKFGQNLDQLLEYHNIVTTDQLEGFQRLFQSVFDSLEMVSLLLDDLVTNIETAVQPIYDVMVSIQMQDIFRQNLQALNKSLDILLSTTQKVAGKEDADDEELLNYFRFSSRVLEISVELIDIIENEMSHSLEELTITVGGIQNDLDTLQSDSSLLTAFLGGSRKDPTGNVIEEIFSSMFDFTRDFSKELQELLVGMEETSLSNRNFEDILSVIEGEINQIVKQIDFLQRLKLMAQIELARIDISHSSFVQELTNITNQIEGDVDYNKDFVKVLNTRLNKDLEKFEQILKINDRNIHQMREVVTTSQSELDLLENLVEEAIMALGSSISRLMNEIAGLQRLLNSGVGLPGQLLTTRGIFMALREELIQKEALLQEKMMVPDGINDSELLDYLEMIQEHFDKINHTQSSEEDGDEDQLVLF